MPRRLLTVIASVALVASIVMIVLQIKADAPVDGLKIGLWTLLALSAGVGVYADLKTVVADLLGISSDSRPVPKADVAPLAQVEGVAQIGKNKIAVWVGRVKGVLQIGSNRITVGRRENHDPGDKKA